MTYQQPNVFRRQLNITTIHNLVMIRISFQALPRLGVFRVTVATVLVAHQLGRLTMIGVDAHISLFDEGLLHASHINRVEILWNRRYFPSILSALKP